MGWGTDKATSLSDVPNLAFFVSSNSIQGQLLGRNVGLAWNFELLYFWLQMEMISKMFLVATCQKWLLTLRQNKHLSLLSTRLRSTYLRRYK